MSKVIHLDRLRRMTLHLRVGSNLPISVKITSAYYKCFTLSKVTLLENLQDKWKLVYVLVYFTENIAIDIIIS